MYVKICGLQTTETVAAAVDAGADAIGFVFAPGSPRTVTAELAAELGSTVPERVETVGVFRNQPIDEVVATARRAGVTTVQLHGDESLADMARLHGEGFRTLRAFSANAYNALPGDERLASIPSGCCWTPSNPGLARLLMPPCWSTAPRTASGCWPAA